MKYMYILILFIVSLKINAESLESSIRNFGGHQVDHLAIGVNDTKKGLEWLEKLTGAKSYLVEPEPGQWYQSGGLVIGEGVLLEIIGPNPNHNGFHPIKQVLKNYKQPNLMFWYISVKDFDAFENFAKKKKIPLETIQTMDYYRNGKHISYKRSTIGPGFLSDRPNIIQWISRQDRSMEDRSCKFEKFWIETSEYNHLKELFVQLGLTIELKSKLEGGMLHLEMHCPRGKIHIEGISEDFRGLSSIFKFIKIYWGYLWEDQI